MDQQALQKFLKRSQGFGSPGLEAAFAKIDRKDFVRQDYQDAAYGDFPLPIGFGGTISQPSTVLFMFNLLDPKPGEKILDVGSGSGWTTALLAAAVGPNGTVFGVEIIPELAKFGADNLAKYQMPWAKISPAGKGLGLPAKAPFDKILVSAAAKELPDELLGQLQVGGTATLVVGPKVVKIVKRSKIKLDREEFPGFAFVPLR